MINLLPEDRKSDIRAARVNIILATYAGITLMAAVFLVTVLFISYTVLQSTKTSADAIVSDNDLKTSVYSSTQAKVEDLRSTLSQTQDTISNEVRFSKVLTSLGSIMPQGAIINSLNLNDSSFNGSQTTINITTKDENTANESINDFKASPMFLSVEAGTIEQSGDTAGYPVSVNLTVIFNRETVK